MERTVWQLVWHDAFMIRSPGSLSCAVPTDTHTSADTQITDEVSDRTAPRIHLCYDVSDEGSPTRPPMCARGRARVDRICRARRAVHRHGIRAGPSGGSVPHACDNRRDLHAERGAAVRSDTADVSGSHGVSATAARCAARACRFTD